MKSKIVSIALLFITAMVWGFAFVGQVEGAKLIAPFTFNGVRFFLGAASLVPVMLLLEKGKSDKEEQKRTIYTSVIAGIILFAASSLQQIGIEITESSGVAGFITGLYTVFIPIACFFLFRQKTGLYTWLGAILAVVGLFLLCYKPGSGISFGLGELLILIGAFFWTAHVIVIDRLGKSVRSLHLSLGQFSVCAALGIISMFLFEEPSLTNIIDAKWSILYCGILSVGVAYTLQVVAQKRVDPTFAAIVLSTEAVFSAVGGVIFGIDTLTVFGYCGCILMFLGIVLSQLPSKSDRKGTGE